jgi:hypothetical protein
MTVHEESSQIGAKANTTVSASVIRGQQSYTFFYIILGFALSVEGSVIMASPLGFFCNVMLFVIVGALSFYLVLYNGWVHDRLISWKNSYEDKPR